LTLNYVIPPLLATMEGDMKEEEILRLIRNTLPMLSSIAEDANLPSLVFLIGMAELEVAQAEAIAKHDNRKK
jgi:hypothetical protein